SFSTRNHQTGASRWRSGPITRQHGRNGWSTSERASRSRYRTNRTGRPSSRAGLALLASRRPAHALSAYCGQCRRILPRLHLPVGARSCISILARGTSKVTLMVLDQLHGTAAVRWDHLSNPAWENAKDVGPAV